MCIRDSYTDKSWSQTHPQDWLYIERLCDDCPHSAAALTEAEIASAMNRAARSLHDRTTMWTGIANRIWQFVGRNEIGKVRETPSGLKGQYSAFGTFDLKPDEALILTLPDTQADYLGVQLASRWFVSLDYRTHISSLTRAQTRPDSDGAIRYVIAHKDPGVWNWLDPAGYKEGLIMIRWQGLEGQGLEGQGLGGKPDNQPQAQLVKLDDLAAHLPPETVFVTPPERREQLKQRLRSIGLRFQ